MKASEASRAGKYQAANDGESKSRCESGDIR